MSGHLRKLPRNYDFSHSPLPKLHKSKDITSKVGKVKDITSKVGKVKDITSEVGKVKDITSKVGKVQRYHFSGFKISPSFQISSNFL